MSFKLEPVEYKPLRRFTTNKVEERRRMYEANILEDGLFMKVLVRVMNPRIEHYFKDEEVAYIELTNHSTCLILNDSSRVMV